jgi:hypothetical protein
LKCEGVIIRGVGGGTTEPAEPVVATSDRFNVAGSSPFTNDIRRQKETFYNQLDVVGLHHHDPIRSNFLTSMTRRDRKRLSIPTPLTNEINEA